MGNLGLKNLRLKKNAGQQWRQQKATHLRLLWIASFQKFTHLLFGTNSLYKLPDARRLRPVKPPRPMRRRRRWGGPHSANFNEKVHKPQS